MSRGSFMELLVRIALMHQRTLSKGKIDLTQWLLEIVQNHIRFKTTSILRSANMWMSWQRQGFEITQDGDRGPPEANRRACKESLRKVAGQTLECV